MILEARGVDVLNQPAIQQQTLAQLIRPGTTISGVAGVDVLIRHAQAAMVKADIQIAAIQPVSARALKVSQTVNNRAILGN